MLVKFGFAAELIVIVFAFVMTVVLGVVVVIAIRRFFRGEAGYERL